MCEKLAIPKVEWPRAIGELCGLNHIKEADVLSTCNRMEIYVVALSQRRGVKEVTEWMSKPIHLKGDIPLGIDEAYSTDVARSASDIVLTEPGLSVIISVVLTSRAIFHRMKNYTIYAVSITIRIVLGFMLLVVFWKFDFPPFMAIVIVVFNDGTIMTISKDRVKPSPFSDSWKLSEIFVTGVALGSYLALMNVVFFWAAYETDFFHKHFGVENFNQHKLDMKNPSISTPIKKKLSSVLYLKISTISQTLIFVTRSRGWSFTERPRLLLEVALTGTVFQDSFIDSQLG